MDFIRKIGGIANGKEKIIKGIGIGGALMAAPFLANGALDLTGKITGNDFIADHSKAIVGAGAAGAGYGAYKGIKSLKNWAEKPMRDSEQTPWSNI